MSAASQQSGEGVGLETTQFMNRIRQLPSNVQRVIIGLIFLTLLVGLVFLKDMIKTEEDQRSLESSE
ncbi:MAG: hypothetical protein WA996_19105 [Candidatus Promineifilaceae bacterium]